MKILPRDNPRLNLKFYTKIFEYFLSEFRDYQTLKELLESYPPYLVNQDYLLDIIKKHIENEAVLADNEIVLDILFILHESNKDYTNAFHILVKSKNLKLFAFLMKQRLDIDLNVYLGNLLLIDARLTVEYLMHRYGMNQ